MANRKGSYEMSYIKINPHATESQLVGIIPKVIVKYYGIKCSSYEVYLPPGVLKHLKKRGHWDDFIKYHENLPNMISSPDYAGQNPDEPDSVELYSIMGDRILIAIKLKPSTDLFLGTFFILKNGDKKIQGRLNTGRIHPFSSFF
ncbi:plasmid-related protein [Lentibacillus halophilus]